MKGQVSFPRDHNGTTDMKFIEMTGATLREMLNTDEMEEKDLRAEGVDDKSIVRINEQGDIEIRRPPGWDVIGGLLGEFQGRIKKASGLEWA